MPATSPARAVPRSAWLRELAAGYLPQYPAVSAERGRGRQGYRFRPRARSRAGFFVGYLTGRFPACAVWAFVEPAGGALHKRLIQREDSLFRQSYGFVTKYTARGPRFELRQEQAEALGRQAPLALFPPQQRERHARNFFTETLALFQRCGLVERLTRGR